MTTQATITPTRTGRVTQELAIAKRSLPYLDYYPLQEGNSWEYQGLCRLVDPQLACPEESRTREHEAVLRIEPVAENAFHIRLHHQILEEDGYLAAFDTCYRLDGERLTDPEGLATYLQMPLTPDSSWQWSAGENTHEIRIESLGGLEVPAGYFPHVLKLVDRVRSGQGHILSTRMEWYALNVGRIKSHLIYNQPVQAGCIEELRELTGYSVQR